MKAINKLKISVIIPVKNGACALGRCLKSIRDQVGVGKVEIIILDSGSKDQSVAIAKEFGALVLSIPPQEFNHGLTRNMGVDVAGGDLLFFTVQDACLSEADILQKMSNHFSKSEVMGVVGHQAVPHDRDKNPLLWFRRFTEPQIRYKFLKQPADYQRLTDLQKIDLIAWDNVVAMYRKTSLVVLPFSKTGFAEDWIWSRDALLKGYTLVYDPSLIVYHYHHLSYDYAYRMNFTVNYHMYKYFGFEPTLREPIFPAVRAGYHLIKNEALSWREKSNWWIYNITASIAFYKSNRKFKKVLFNKGLVGIETAHEQICMEIPQGKQKPINETACC